MRHLAFLFILFALFTSCQGEDKIVYITFEDSEGIAVDDPVLLNDVSVGKVVDVDFTKDHKVLTAVQLSDSIDFPDDSMFEIEHQDLFNKGIYMKLGESNSFLKKGDTIRGINKTDQGSQIPGSNPPKALGEVKEILRNVNV